MHRKGLCYDGGAKNWTKRHREWLNSLELSVVCEEILKSYYTGIVELEEKLLHLEERIKEFVQEERCRERVNKLRCLKGVDTLTATHLVVEVGNFSRLPTAESFMGYLGLVPAEESSGDKIRRGGITKAGNSHLLRVLIESAWHYNRRSGYAPSARLTQRRPGESAAVVAYADKCGRRLSRKCLRLSGRLKPANVITVAAARELAGFAWGMMTDLPAAATMRPHLLPAYTLK